MALRNASDAKRKKRDQADVSSRQERDAGQPDLFATEEGEPAEFAYEYTAAYIPYRGRKYVSENLLGKDFAFLRRPTNGVSPAFRVTFPDGHYFRKDGFDILSYDDKFFWPIRIGGREWDGRHLTEWEILHELKTGNWNVLRTFADIANVPDPPRPTRSEEDLVGVREFGCQAREFIVAEAKQLAHENILLHDGKAWFRGGEPVYANSLFWTFVPDVANTGADRSARIGEWLNVGSANFNTCQRMFRAGEFQLTDRYDDAEAAAAQHSVHAPMIEVLRPEMMRLVPARLRMDAIFRSAYGFSSWALHRWRRSGASDYERRLRELAWTIYDGGREDGDPEAIDSARLNALSRLRQFCETDELPEDRPHSFGMLAWDVRRFWETEKTYIRRVLRRQPPSFSPEDAAALEALAK